MTRASDTHATHSAWWHTSCTWASSGHSSSHARHAHAHHGIHLLCHHHELELFLLHMLSDHWILVYLVLEQCSFELVLRPLVVLEDPVVGYCTYQHRHDHWVLRHYFEILLFE